MSTQQLQLVCDSSTLANFKAWAKPISDWFRSAAGYTNTADSGQVNWSTIAAVPGSAAYVYDIFQSNDAFTQFFLKVEYGNTAGTNQPNVRITIGTGTNGSGTITGFITTAFSCSPSGITPPSTTTQYECDFTGDSANSRIGVMMWRNGPSSQGQMLFAIERSVNASGASTSTYVTLYAVGNNAGTNISGKQQSLYFGVGAAPILPDHVLSGNPSGLCLRIPNPTLAGGSSFNGSIPFDTCAPYVGLFDYAGTMLGAGWGADFAEGVTFTVTLYGSTRTYMPGKIGAFAQASGNSTVSASMALCMRYD